MAIVIENNDIDFSKVSLGIPNQLQANSFFSRIYYNNDPFIIQAPQCITSNGIKKYKNKIITDLIFINHAQGTNEFYNFFVQLENNIKKSLLNNKDDWFEDDVTMDDIDESFQSPLLFHDKGIKIKAYIQHNNLDTSIKFNCYDINHNIISNDLFTSGINFIPIFEIVGCKFSNKFFTIEIRLLQALIVNSIVDNSKPLFSSNTKISNVISNHIEEDSNPDDSSTLYEPTTLDEPTTIDEPTTLDEPITIDEPITLDKTSETDEIDKTSETNQHLNLDNNIKVNEIKESYSSSNSEKINNLENDIDEESDNDSQINLNDNDYDVQDTNKNIEEVLLNLEYLDNNPVKLKTHADIYHEIWKLYKDEAYKHRRQNLKTYLNSRNIISNILINEL